MNLTYKEIAAALRIPFGGVEQSLSFFTWDSREMRDHALFAALKGERVNGASFIPALDVQYKNIAFLTEEPLDFVPRNPVFRVGDIKNALAVLAGVQVKKRSAKIIGVTGSVGKTTTKDFIVSALSACFSVSGTVGNQNNELGIPNTVFSIREEDRAAVIEMGMRGPGQIRAIAAQVPPDLAVITNIGVAHLELLGSRENIARAKLEMVDALRPGGQALLNGDEPLLRGARPDRDCYYFGFSDNNDYYATDRRGTSFILHYPGGELPVSLQVEGEHQVMNALAAFGAGHLLGCDPALLGKGLEAFRGDGRRMFTEQAGGITVIDDSYNAAPDSMRAALTVLASKPGRRAAVLGDMLELGAYEEEGHRMVGRICADLALDAVYTAGERAALIDRSLPETMEHRHFEKAEEILPILEKALRPGDAVLFKASNAMNFHALAAAFKERMEK